MKKKISVWQMVGFLFTAVAGTLLHFLLDWTGGKVVAALFSAVNESIWGHLKLLFYPMMAFALAEYYVWGRGRGNFWSVKLLGVLTGMLLIVTAYYTYTGALGIKADWLNIALFFFAAGVTFWMETKLFHWGFSCRVCEGAAVAALCAMAVLFTVFTFCPPCVPIFRDPQTGSYGFKATVN